MNRAEQVNSIVNQIIRCGRSNMKISKKKKEQCTQDYEKEVYLAMELLPQAQATFLAAIAKKLKEADKKEKVVEFCTNYKNRNFSGQNDPVFLLWKFLKTASRKPSNLYPSVSYALRSYLEGRKIRSIRNDRSLSEICEID